MGVREWLVFQGVMGRSSVATACTHPLASMDGSVCVCFFSWSQER